MKKLLKFSSILFLGVICLTAFSQSLEARNRSSTSFGISFGTYAPAPTVVQYRPAPVVVERHCAVYPAYPCYPAYPVYPATQVVSYDAPPAPVPPPSNLVQTPRGVVAVAPNRVLPNRVPLSFQNQYVAPRTYVYEERVVQPAPVNYTSFSWQFTNRR